MNEKTIEAAGADMPRGCGRADELVAYLYGEAEPADAQAFQKHLGACSVCREELDAFSGVRHSVALWREEAHDLTPSLDLREITNSARVPIQSAPSRSAAAALREFFSLAPLWLRAGVTAAALAVCAIAAFTIARGEIRWDDSGFAFRAGVLTREETTQSVAQAPATPVRTTYTQEQVDAIVAERVRDELAAARVLLETQTVRATEPEAATVSRRPVPRLVEASGRDSAVRRRSNARSIATRLESAGGDELSLPRLSDLLGGAYD